jgi:hypothetical protein
MSQIHVSRPKDAGTLPKPWLAVEIALRCNFANGWKQGMVCNGRTSRVRFICAAVAVLALTGCNETVWVRPGATPADSEAAMEQCLSDAYLQAPSAPATRSIGSDVAPPSFTTCSGLGRSGVCVTSRGQYTQPLMVRYDANARPRSQIFRQCMLAAGWSEQSRMDGTTPQTIDDDWTRGFAVGMREGAAARCTPSPAGVVDARSWSLGCQSGQNAR